MIEARDALTASRREVRMGQRVRWGTGVASMASALLVASLAAAPEADAKSSNIQQESRIELGRRLFLDPIASRGGKFSCASCHDPEHGFSDPRVVSVDETGTSNRHSQPVTDLAGDGFHWDGEFDTIRQLLVARLGTAQAAVEQTVDLLDTRFAAAARVTERPDRGTYDRRRQIVRPPYYGSGGLTPTTPSSRPPVVARLELDGRYDEGFKRAYGTTDITPDRVVDAVAAFMESLRTEENAFDRYRHGSLSALSDSARRGLTLFRGKAGCDTCHVTRGDGGHNLSDGAFHATGVAYRISRTSYESVLRPVEDITLNSPRDVGRAGQTFVPDEIARFKTPSLRDVARRAPYMHDGSFASLADVVDYYNRGGTQHVGIDEAIRPLGLTDAEKGDLVAFLESLTGDERAGLGDVPRYVPDTARIRLRDPAGKFIPDLTVRVIPAGDRLRGTDAMPEPFEVQANEYGWIEFPFPASTQVRLESDAHEIAMSRLIADWTRKLEVVAAPLDHVTVTVRRVGEMELPGALSVRPMAGSGTTDASFTLPRVQRVNSDVAIYSAPLADVLAELDRPITGVVSALLGSHRTPFEIDLAGGHSEPADFRVDSTQPFGSLPLTVADQRERRGPGGGVLPPAPRKDKGRPDVPGVKRPDINVR